MCGVVSKVIKDLGQKRHLASPQKVVVLTGMDMWWEGKRTF